MDSREAEVACENYWISQGAVKWRRPVRTKYQKQDYLGADVLAVMPDGHKTWSQVTTSKNAGHIRERRRKLEKTPWALADRVFVFEVEERRNVVKPQRIDRFFRVHEYLEPDVPLGLSSGARTWEIWSDAILITPEMLRVRKAKLATTKTPE